MTTNTTKNLRISTRNVYAGYQLAGNGGDPIIALNQFMIAYGGKGFITSNGKLHTDDSRFARRR